MTYAEDLTTSRDNLASTLATESANPRPNYSVDGRSYSWDQYRSSLVQQIADLNQAIINANGGVEAQNIAFG
jgi:hypothetical protein